MAIFHNPQDIAAPIALYSHGVEVPSGARWLVVSGQIGVDTNGEMGADVTSQSENVWKNIEATLRAAKMRVTDIVKMTAYLLDAADLADYGAVRSRYLGEHRPASTLIYVSGLAKPEVRVEVEVIAARED